MLHNFVHLYSGITLGCALGALLGLNPPFWGFFMFVQNVIMYVVIVVFMVLNSNLQVSIPETVVHPFGMSFTSPWGLLGLNIPQNAHFDQKRHFWPLYLD